MVRVPWWVLVLAAINTVMLTAAVVHLVRWDANTVTAALLSLVIAVAAGLLYRALQDADDDFHQLYARMGAIEDRHSSASARHSERLNGHQDRMDAQLVQMDALRLENKGTGDRVTALETWRRELADYLAEHVAELHQRVKGAEQHVKGTEDTNTLLLGRITELEAWQKGERGRGDFFAEHITMLANASDAVKGHVRALDVRLDEKTEALSERVTSLEQKRRGGAL